MNRRLLAPAIPARRRTRCVPGGSIQLGGEGRGAGIGAGVAVFPNRKVPGGEAQCCDRLLRAAGQGPGMRASAKASCTQLWEDFGFQRGAILPQPAGFTENFSIAR